MLKIENITVHGFEEAIRGMRNPKNSWHLSDSTTLCDSVCSAMEGCDLACKVPRFLVGEKDHELMMTLAKGGPVHGKFRRMLIVYADITAPLYWWKEFDTYKVGTVANSCSTMHKIHAKEFVLDDFSHEHLLPRSLNRLRDTIEELNVWRDIFLNGGEVDNGDGTIRVFEPRDKDAWWQMIQLLGSDYNQRRTVMFSYEVAANIYQYRHNHKLDEWHTLCDAIKELPYSELITCNTEAD